MGQYKHVQPKRVWFLAAFSSEIGYQFWPFWSQIGYSFCTLGLNWVTFSLSIKTSTKGAHNQFDQGS